MQQQKKTTNLLESRELVEQHAQHHLIGLLWQVGQEQNLVGRSVIHALHRRRASNRSAHGGNSALALLTLLAVNNGPLGPLCKGTLDLGNEVGVSLAVRDSHGFVVEGKTFKNKQLKNI